MGFAFGNVLHPLQDADPIDESGSRPECRIDRDGLEHRGAGPAVPRERLDRRELAYGEIGRRQSATANDAAGDEALQCTEHALEVGFRPLIARGVRDLHHVGGERVFAEKPFRGEVLHQSVAILVRRQARDYRAPCRLVPQSDRLRHALLVADVAVGFEELAHRSEFARERTHYLYAHAAAAGHCVAWPLDRKLQRLVELREGRLVHAYRVHRDHALRHAQPVGRASGLGAYFPVHLREADWHSSGNGEEPSLAGGQLQPLHAALERPAGCIPPRPVAHFPSELDGQRRRGGVAQRKHRREFVLLTHERRQPRKQHKVLRAAHARRAAAETRGALVRHRHKAEGGQRVVEWHLDPRPARSIQRHAPAP